MTLIGTGGVGRDITRLVARRDDVRIVGCCSRNPDYVGRDLGQLAGGDPLELTVQADLEGALDSPSDVAVVATASFLGDIASDLRTAVEAGRHVLTTSEEAAFPWSKDGALADELDALAGARGVSILGAGVNPGFVFDTLPLTAAGAAWDVDRMVVDRTVDISLFSDAILRRSGVGFDEDDFRSEVAAGRITGHIGLPQSMHIVGRALGRPIERIEESIAPIVAERRFEGPDKIVEAGQTAGFTQEYTGYDGDDGWYVARMLAHMDPAAIGHPVRDVIEIEGEVPVRVVADPGVSAQSTVAAVVVNSLRRLVDAPSGWLTVADLPPARPYQN